MLLTFSDFRHKAKNRDNKARLYEIQQVSSLLSKTDSEKIQKLTSVARKFYSSKDLDKKMNLLMDSLLISASMGWSADAD